jgi:TonB family protein
MIATLLAALAAQAAPSSFPAEPVPAVRARARPMAVFPERDIPRRALFEPHGDVGYRLVIGANGRVERCDIIAPSGSSTLDEATCRLLQRRARYEPARDADGRAVPDSLVSRASWALPPGVILANYVTAGDYPLEALRRREQGRVEFELAMTPAGRAGDCRILRSSGSAVLDRQTCAIMRVRAHLPPARDAEGRPAAAVVRSAIVWRIPGRSLALINPRPAEARRLAGRGYE